MSGSIVRYKNVVKKFKSNFNPKHLELAAWYDASDTSTITEISGSMSQWDDKSGNNRHLVQGTGSNQPSTGIRSINTINAIDFSGSNEYMDSPTWFDSRMDFSVFSVLELDTISTVQAFLTSLSGTGTGRAIIRLNGSKQWDSPLDGSGFNFFSGQAGVTIMMSIVFDWNGTTTDIASFENGVTEGSGNLTPDVNSNAVFRIGVSKTNGAPLNAKVGEVIITPSVSVTERHKVEGYLAWKWGLQANLPGGHPYVNEAP